MWNFIQDNLYSVVLVDHKTNTLTIKIYGFEDIVSAEMVGQMTMNLLNFEYDEGKYRMQSKMLH